MKNTKRILTYTHIRRMIKDCITFKQLEKTIGMIANHRNTKEVDALTDLYNKKNHDLKLKKKENTANRRKMVQSLSTPPIKRFFCRRREKFSKEEIIRRVNMYDELVRKM